MMILYINQVLTNLVKTNEAKRGLMKPPIPKSLNILYFILTFTSEIFIYSLKFKKVMDVNTANQSTTDEQMMDILLVLDKEKKTISAVKGVDENGELQTVPPENNSELLKFDRHGDFFSNFFSNMINQLKNPTRFNFFKIPKIELPKIEPIIRDNFNHPTPENEAGIERYRVTPETVKQEAKKEQQETQTQQPQVQQPAKETGATAQAPQQPDKSKYVIDPDKVDWEALKNFGLSKEQLEKAKALEPMLRGYKSPGAFSIAGNYNSAIMKLDARLSFRHDKDGNVVLAIHGIRQKPELERPFFGHEFSKEDKANLLETGNMGRIVNLKNYITGEMIPSFISVDKVTNELVSMRASSVQIPDEIKGVKLNKEQKEALREGKGVFLENMISNRKNPFSATVQVNADKKSLEFIYPNAKQSQEQRQKLEQQNNLVTSDGVTIPKSISGIELTCQQQQDLVNDKTIFVAGLKDKRGVEYDAYIQVNHDKKKLGFYSDNPSFDRSAVKEITPASKNRTQVAVNSEGKTNEATKKVKEPLKKGQNKPTEKQKTKQDKKEKQEQTDKPKQSRGRKR
jgi:hypothetical protein